MIMVTPYIAQPAKPGDLARPDDSFVDAHDGQALLLGRLNRLYGVARAAPVRGAAPRAGTASSPTREPGPPRPLALAAVAAPRPPRNGLGACAPDRVVTGSTYPFGLSRAAPDRARPGARDARHLRRRATGLDPRQEDDLRAFAAEFRRRGQGPMTAELPAGPVEPDRQAPGLDPVGLAGRPRPAPDLRRIRHVGRGRPSSGSATKSAPPLDRARRGIDAHDRRALLPARPAPSLREPATAHGPRIREGDHDGPRCRRNATARLSGRRCGTLAQESRDIRMNEAERRPPHCRRSSPCR